MIHSPSPRRRWAAGLSVAAVAALALSACSGGADPDEAAAEGGELTVWAWDPTIEYVAEAYEDANPEVSVEVVNVGTGNDHYTALQNAASAGSGGPDLAQVEYQATTQFILGEALADLTEFGAGDLADEFAPGPWAGVSSDEAVYGLPLDSGPMALFYNEAVFDEHGIEVPETWDDYLEAARDLQEADPDVYLTNDTGDAGLTTSIMWQAGGHPFTVDGTSVGIDFGDEGSQRFGEVWQPMIDEQLLAPISSWSDEWYQGLGDGTIASLVIGAWMPGNLEGGVPDAAGDWRVAPMPQWDDAGFATAEQGGSGMSVMSGSDHQALAYDFLEFAAVGGGKDLRVDDGVFPATTADLEDPQFVEREYEYFGGQQINQVLSESSAAVVDGWDYLPYQVYANTVFNDSVGQAFVSGTTLEEGLAGWQDTLRAYGEDQGFTIE
ncbi:ABC transporter substrate-binding protein [Zhihengliuella halotolerans]|uniref:Carbohydrate ABC transporter substrate-binding protein (CUT1 family) n=1 Tax=Zhihengliuella halotolerans TaxID=370736 RepID=A0A4Q8AHQ6_9MICC|nr:sugar ABC transporter substrate-binding protein [Zhihengliuella halotolerans]RZU63441.1 carbohydrate ABC transporter substrate-binding protein (CUT1 family) [Zhihengliuella halotolerans]